MWCCPAAASTGMPPPGVPQPRPHATLPFCWPLPPTRPPAHHTRAVLCRRWPPSSRASCGRTTWTRCGRTSRASSLAGPPLSSRTTWAPCRCPAWTIRTLGTWPVSAACPAGGGGVGKRGELLGRRSRVQAAPRPHPAPPVRCRLVAAAAAGDVQPAAHQGGGHAVHPAAGGGAVRAGHVGGAPTAVLLLLL